MCTLVLLQRPSELLAISGNRNELLSRPARGPMVEKGILAPRDELAHGSWLGLNRHGLFVCVTNRRGAMIDPSRKSRGLLVLEALQARSARGLHDALLELRGDRHNGFHLVYADLRDAFVSWSDGYAVQHALLAPGQVHVITERSFGAGEGARERSVLEAFAGLEPAGLPGALPIPSSVDTPGVKNTAQVVVKVSSVGCGGIVTGSGFPVGDGYVVTNAHVVANAQKVSVMRRDGTVYPAQVLGTDEHRDEHGVVGGVRVARVGVVVQICVAGRDVFLNSFDRRFEVFARPIRVNSRVTLVAGLRFIRQR